MASSNLLLQETPTEEEMEEIQNYLINIWDSLLLALPILKNNPHDMRQWNADGSDPTKDNILWFRPIGQTSLLAPLARRLMSDQDITSSSSQEEISKALKPLSLIPAQLHHGHWKDFFDNFEIQIQ